MALQYQSRMQTADIQRTIRRVLTIALLFYAAIAAAAAAPLKSSEVSQRSAASSSRTSQCPKPIESVDMTRVKKALRNVCGKAATQGESVCSGACMQKVVHVMIFGADVNELLEISGQTGEYMRTSIQTASSFTRSGSIKRTRAAQRVDAEVDLVDHCVIDPYITMLKDAEAIDAELADVMLAEPQCSETATGLIRQAFQKKMDRDLPSARRCGCTEGQSYGCNAENECTGVGAPGDVCQVDVDCFCNGDNGTPSLTCLGDCEDDPTVCGTNGVCSADPAGGDSNVCVCNAGFVGSQCQFTTFPDTEDRIVGIGLSC